MKDMLLHAIDKLTAAGFTPLVTICDQGSNNRSSIGKLDITVSRPYFEHNCHRDICMYDPPHLLKNIRNNLKKTGYTVNGQKISWEHISSFYYKDINTGPLRYAPSLTEKHIRLPPFAALRVLPGNSSLLSLCCCRHSCYVTTSNGGGLQCCRVP